MKLPAALVGLALSAACPAAAEEPVAPADRTKLAACLDKARQEGTPTDRCIGIILGPCVAAPGGDTTVGMKECTGREISVWDERLNAAYRRLLDGPLGRLDTQRATERSRKPRNTTGAQILREAQRAWVTMRDKKCDAAGLPMEGGTGAGLLSVSCFLDETARQALWLEDMGRED